MADINKAARIIKTDLKYQMDKLEFIRELCRAASQAGGAFEVGRITKGLSCVLYEVNKAYQKVSDCLGPKDYSLRCFEAAFDAACEHEEENPVIVHGLVSFQYGPAIRGWCEVDNLVYDYTLRREPFEKDAYYQMQGVTDKMLEYSLLEACKLIIETGGYGPSDGAYFLQP